ncbi:hypothetical protein D3C80_2194360 [compost metagenome]
MACIGVAKVRGDSHHRLFTVQQSTPGLDHPRLLEDPVDAVQEQLAKPARELGLAHPGLASEF